MKKAYQDLCAYVVKHHRPAVAFLLLLSILASQGAYIPPVKAASYSLTWDSQNDFQSNTVSGWATSTVGTISGGTGRIDTTTTAGSFQLGKNASQTVTDSFASGNGHLDFSTTTAVVSGSLLKRNTTDTFTNITSYLSGITATYSDNIGQMRYDSIDNKLFALVGKFSPYDATTIVAIDLTNHTSSYVENNFMRFPRIAYDPVNNKLVYTESWNTPYLYVYNPTTGVKTSLFSKFPSIPQYGASSDVFYNQVNGLFYISSNNGIPAQAVTYNAGTTATGTVSTTGTTFRVPVMQGSYENVAYDGYSNSMVWVADNGSGALNLYRLSSSNVFSNIQSTDYFSYWPNITLDAATGNIYSITGWFDTSRKFNNSGTYSGLVGYGSTGATDAQALAYDSYSGDVYYSGCNNQTYGCDSGETGYIYKYNGSSITDLTSAYQAAMGTTTPVYSVYSDGNGRVYWGGTTGTLAYSTSPASTQVAVSYVIATSTTKWAHATLTASSVTLNGGTVTYQLSNDNGVTWTTVSSGVEHTFSGAGTQLKYKVIITGAATVGQIAVAYDDYTTATLSNMKKDANADSQWVNIFWNVTLPSNTSIVFKTRGATAAEGAAALYEKSWSDAYTATTTGAGGIAIKANGAGGAALPTYQYMEVEAILTSSDGVAIPIVNSVGMSYALNAAPDFNQDYPTTSAGGALAAQVSDSSDSNWGKVRIDYAVEDIDTDSGTANPGFISPSFEYRLNSGDSWHAITSGYLTSGATNSKAVLQGGYTTYSTYWDAQGQIPGQYSATTQIRVTANDNEAIYNIGYATSSAAAVDAKVPALSTFRLNGGSSTSTVTIASTDDTTIKDYKLSNNSDLSADDSNGTSGTLQTVSASTLSLNQPWTVTGTSTNTVYLVIRDIYGNTSTTSAIAPGASTTFEIHDISNVAADTYKLIVAWTPYTNQTGATFASYKLFRSTDGSTYSLYQTITDSTLNYYLDTSISSTTTYYYKLQTVDSDGDASSYTDVVSATPSGQGGSSLPPIISSVTVDNVKNTSARVTWTTNTLTDSVVSYGPTTSYGSTKTVSSYVTSHQAYLTNLQPSTTYYFKVSSTDFYDNTTEDTNVGASYSFTTVGGPALTNVTVNSITDSSAHIFWNTDNSSDSHVYYSTNANLSSPSTAGTNTRVSTTTSAGIYSHDVELTGLNSATTYYFYVTSTDVDSNLTRADNNGDYYSFLTTRDTSPPVISGIDTPVINSSQIVVTWNTDKAADSQIEWGTSSAEDGSYGSLSDVDTTMSRAHIGVLTDLDPTTTYYFRVRSTDVAGNSAYSDEQTVQSAAEDTIIITRSRSGAGDAAAKTAPTINNITVDANAFDANIRVTTNPDTRVVIDYGETSSSTPNAPYTLSAGSSGLGSSNDIKLYNLKPNGTYHFTATVVDENGNTTKSKEQTFTTEFVTENLSNRSLLDRASDLQNRLDDLIQSALPSILPPFIDTPVVSSTTENGAVISWKTNIKAYGLVAYAADAKFSPGSSEYTDQITDELATTSLTHSIALTGLQPNTRYHFSVRSFVFPQVVGKSADFTFTTKSAPVKPQVLDVKPDSFRVIWNTDLLTSSYLDYTDKSTGFSQTAKVPALTKQHDVVAENVTSGHSYAVRAYGFDKDGNEVGMSTPITVIASVDKTIPQVTSLRIDSNLVPGRTDIIQSIVSWKTDKPSTSVVYYEEGSGTADQTLKNKIENNTGFVQEHVVLLPSLKPATIYRIQVSSTDQAGNTMMLPVRTIVTPQQSESIIDIIFKNFSGTFNFSNQ